MAATRTRRSTTARKSTSAKRKTAGRKTTAKRTTAKRTSAKKSTQKRTTSATAKRRTAAKRTTTKRATTKRTTAKKTTGTTTGVAQITGNFEGQINAKGDLHITSTASCKAKMSCRNLKIDGTFVGNCSAASKMEITRNGKLKGAVVADRLVVADGACFEGTFKVGNFNTGNKAAKKSRRRAA